MSSRLLQGAVLAILAQIVGTGAGRVWALTSAKTGFHFLEEPLSARAMGMGSAGTALGTPGFAYYNPAGPFLLGRPYVAADYGQQSAADLGRSSIEAVVVGRQWFAGANAATFTVDDLYETSERGIGPGFSWQESMLSLTAGLVRGDFAVGAALHGIQATAGVIAGYGLSASAGLAYRALENRLRLGAAGFHLGAATPMVDSLHELGEGSALPMNGRVGASWSDTLRGLPYTVAADIAYRYEDDKVMAPVGIEVRPLRFLSIRVGKRFGHDTELLNFGFGLSVSSLSADAAFVVPRYVSDTEMKWLIGLTYSLTQPEKRSPGTRPAAASAASRQVVPAPAAKRDVLDTTAVEETPGPVQGGALPNPAVQQTNPDPLSILPRPPATPDEPEGTAPSEPIEESAANPDAIPRAPADSSADADSLLVR